MSYKGSTVAWGKANREHSVDADFTSLIQMCRFDCAHTLYKFCGQVNRRKFGVPMGGFMSPGLAILCCAMVELEMELGPEGLIGTVVSFMDDVFGIYAVGNGAEEQLVREYYGDSSGLPPTTGAQCGTACRPASFLRAGAEHWGGSPPVPTV